VPIDGHGNTGYIGIWRATLGDIASIRWQRSFKEYRKQADEVKKMTTEQRLPRIPGVVNLNVIGNIG